VTKIEIESSTAPFPKPSVLVGAIIEGRPNFMNLAWLTRISYKPHLWIMSIGINKYTTKGIRERKRFSINLPNVDLVAKLDYCGLTSGADVDKSSLFSIFYGAMKDVPMIEECPVCFELEVIEIIEREGRALVIGEVKHTYTEEHYLTDGKLDQEQLKQLIFTQPPGAYWSFGKKIGDAWSIGKRLLKE